MPDRVPAARAGAAVGATLVGLWIAFGVGVGDITLFAGYEALFVGLPGVLVYRALAPRPGGILRHVAIGWPVGYTIEIGSFALTASLGARWLLPVLPLAAAALAAGFLWWRDRRASAGEAAAEAAFPRAAVWATAAVLIVALGYLALGSFTQTPLPGDVASVSYPADNAFDIGIIAEAKNHWPIEDPSVVGIHLRYHLYGFIHMSAISQVTGIEPSTLLFRLFPGELFVLVGLQLVALGRAIGRSVWIGPLAAGLALLVGELDLDPERPAPLASAFFSNLFQSPSFLFGVALFLAAALLVLGLLSRRDSPGGRWWVLLGIVLIGGGGAKATVLPVILGGLVLWLAWAWGWDRRAVNLRRWLTLAGLAFGALLLSYLLLYSGGSASTRLGLFDFTHHTVFEELIPSSSRSALGNDALTGAVGLLGGIAIVLPALGIVWMLAHRRLRLEPEEAWLLALFLTGLGLFWMLADTAVSQAYFFNYGYLAGCVLSAEGIVLFCTRLGGAWQRPARTTVALIAGALAAGIAGALILHEPGAAGAGLGKLAVGYGVAALAVVGLAVWAGRSAAGRVPALGIALLLTISLGLLNTPLDEAVPVADKVRAGEKVYPLDGQDSHGLTRGLYRGLRWVRDHSSDDDVIAVNNHSIDAAGLDSRYFYYTAFAERRALLESWLYTSQAHAAGYDEVANGEKVVFPRLRRLNDAAFDGNRRALETIRDRYGVRWLLVDRIHALPAPRLAFLGKPAFENDALIVYRLPAGGPLGSG